MHVISNAFFSQAEISQTDRWDHGPLELHMLPQPGTGRTAFGGRVVEWNRHQCSGFLRSEEELNFIHDLGLKGTKNPNLVLVPTQHGYSELMGMLGSLLPDNVLQKAGLRRPKAGFWLWPITELIRDERMMKSHSESELEALDRRNLARLTATIPAVFERWIWGRLAGSPRFRFHDFAATSPLRLLAGDTRFWMHRLYRIAVGLYETAPPVTEEEKSWASMEELQRKLDKNLPKRERSHFKLSRPRMGGLLWDPDDVDDRDWISDLLINGDDTIESLQPVIDTLLGSATHEDLSSNYSWIKEDFERRFYSKRAKVAVKMYEFIDDCPVHDGQDTPGYEDVLFRDLMAFFDQRDQTIILALRQGKTRSEIAEQLGHSGHASVSRRVKAIEQKVRRLLRHQ